jgi:hypothetical protein
MELTPKEIAQVVPGYWADKLYKLQLQGGPFSFKGHEYQIDLMNGKFPRRRCYMKATQGGFSEIEVLNALHGMINHRYRQGVLHMFPTSDDVLDFSKARFAPLIAANKEAIGKYVKSTDTAGLKRIGDAFLYLRGARLAQKVGPNDEGESSKLRGIPVDCVKFDEYDLMDSDAVEKAKGRMGHSLLKEEVYISNPTQEDYGIDLIFKLSDQRYWFRKCTCGHWTSAELSFPHCVKVRKDGTGYIGCDKCGKELPVWAGEGTGEWVAQYPDKSNYMHGYRWSQLTSAFNDPAEILEDFTNPPNGNLGDIYRLRLGLPYSSRDDKLKKSDVLSCCGNDVAPNTHSGPCAMGVDVGKVKHVVIGFRTGNDTYEILRAAKCESFNEIHDLAKRYGVKSAVVDIRPYEDEARQFQRSEPYRIYLCEYSDSMISETQFNDNNGTVKVHRTGIFDSSHRLFMRGKARLPRQTPEVEEFARQCCNCAKFEEKDKKKGTTVYRYRPTGDQQEHFRSALNYFLIAASGSKIARVSSSGSPNKQEFADNSYERVA